MPGVIQAQRVFVLACEARRLHRAYAGYKVPTDSRR
jgi:hypothetical protein